jgi:hypothetical protein
MALEEDLYKSLLEESKLYREKVSTIWLQKFTLLGAVIGFAVTQSRLTTGQNPKLIAAAVLSLPVIAVLLDIKLGEFGIHANVIDHFVKRHYRDPAVLGEWQRTNWGPGRGQVGSEADPHPIDSDRGSDSDSNLYYRGAVRSGIEEHSRLRCAWLDHAFGAYVLRTLYRCRLLFDTAGVVSQVKVTGSACIRKLPHVGLRCQPRPVSQIDVQPVSPALEAIAPPGIGALQSDRRITQVFEVKRREIRPARQLRRGVLPGVGDSVRLGRLLIPQRLPSLSATSHIIPPLVPWPALAEWPRRKAPATGATLPASHSRYRMQTGAQPTN